MADPDKRPIIIIKKKIHGHGGHGGAWKVAFADFVTAMMALFMVLWLVAQSPQTKSAVGAYFRDPLGIESGGNTEINTGPNTGGAGFFEGGNTAVAVDTSFSAGGGGKEQQPSKDLPELSTARSRLTQALMALHMDSWARHVELTAVDEGLRIEIQDGDDLSLFASGSAKLNPAAKSVLAAIAAEIGALPNNVVIEGHTDATPAPGKDTNWELSADRANAARRFFVDAGVRDEQVLEVRGYAERRPKLWHKPADPRNRRISILVMLNEREPKGGTRGEADESGHPLIQRLRALDIQAQGGSRSLDLQADGKVALPP